MILNKYCPDCQRVRPVTEFHKNRRNRDGLGFYCAACARARHAASKRMRLGPPKRRGAEHPQVIPAGKKWCPECGGVKWFGEFPQNRSAQNGLGSYCKPCHNKIAYANREKNGGNRNYHLRRRYGITAEHFDQMPAQQGGLCAICRDEPAIHVDHDHATGRVRGLLCFNCNGGLGKFADDIGLMLRAAAYLQGHTVPFHEPPSSVVTLYVGPTGSPRPEGESFPPDYADDPPPEDEPLAS